MVLSKLYRPRRATCHKGCMVGFFEQGIVPKIADFNLELLINYWTLLDITGHFLEFKENLAHTACQ